MFLNRPGCEPLTLGIVLQLLKISLNVAYIIKLMEIKFKTIEMLTLKRLANRNHEFQKPNQVTSPPQYRLGLVTVTKMRLA